ncbi:MAG: hypothetical protein IMZ55_09040 [Acidobacteria bacterium]|nr:hypothetical protein [Acidobacteriota bacterium]
MNASGIGRTHIAVPSDVPAAAAGARALMHPPRVPLVMRVGVTGHRPDRQKRIDPDVATTRAVAAEVLTIIRSAVNGVADVSGHLFTVLGDGAQARIDRRLRLISALAPGPDQWVADEAVALGYELQCPLPFDRREYREDFSLQEDSAATAEYLRLLDLATAVFELDGRVVRSESGVRQPDSRSYEAVGRAILHQSDLLIAVWDGQPAHGPGGTGQVVDEALRRGIPVVWIPWGRPSAWQLRLPAWRLVQAPHDAKGDGADLMRLVRELLLPSDDAGCQTGLEDLREEYFAEDQKRGNPLHGCWALLRNLVCAEFLRPRGREEITTLKMFRVDPFWTSARDQAARQWTTKQSVADAPMDHPVPSHVRAFVDGAFLPHYAWANGLSMYYGNLHRSAFLLNSLLGAAAVFLALVCIAAGIAGRAQTRWIVGELIVILGILGLTHLGRRRRWHQRWIDYRTLAERLRVARCASLLGGGGPQVLHAGHLASYGNPLRTWMHWHYRAVERLAGLLPNVSFTREYLAACQEFWRESLIQDQRQYHEVTGTRFTKLDRRLHHAGDCLFVLTLVACLLHIAHLWVEGTARFAWVPHWAPGWLTLLSAFLPAAGAALAAIRSQAETHRLAQRSRAMQEALENLQLDLATVSTEEKGLNSQRLRDCADRVSDLMIREMLDWRVVFQDRPLNLPV